MAAFSSLAENKVLYDADVENSGKLVTLIRQESRKLAEEKGLSCLGRIPFDPVFTKSMVQAQTVI